jgi:hypothetical protein
MRTVEKLVDVPAVCSNPCETSNCPLYRMTLHRLVKRGAIPAPRPQQRCDHLLFKVHTGWQRITEPAGSDLMAADLSPSSAPAYREYLEAPLA